MAPVASNSTTNDARMDFRLPSSLKMEIEEAAAALGQSVTDFAVSTLVQTARSILDQRNITHLNTRDRDIFVALLDNPTAKPNKALIAAARRYKKSIG